MLLKHEKSFSSAEAQLWIAQRGGKSVKRAKRERIELDESDLWQYGEPPEVLCKKRGFTAEDALAYGVMWNDENESWIIPIRNPKTGALWGWQEKFEFARYFYNHPRTVNKSATLFGYSSMSDHTEEMVVLVESPLDAVKLWNVGYYAVASYGASVSDTQLRLIANKTNKLVLFLDRDKAGLKSMAKIKKEFLLVRTWIFDYSWMPTHAKDAGEMDASMITKGVENASLGMLTDFDVDD
jgi:5S rRNA maturation endonuclease (ribonuclease M5)